MESIADLDPGAVAAITQANMIGAGACRSGAELVCFLVSTTKDKAEKAGGGIQYRCNLSTFAHESLKLVDPKNFASTADDSDEVQDLGPKFVAIRAYEPPPKVVSTTGTNPRPPQYIFHPPRDGIKNAFLRAYPGTNYFEKCMERETLNIVPGTAVLQRGVRVDSLIADATLKDKPKYPGMDGVSYGGLVKMDPPFTIHDWVRDNASKCVLDLDAIKWRLARKTHADDLDRFTGNIVGLARDPKYAPAIVGTYRMYPYKSIKETLRVLNESGNDYTAAFVFEDFESPAVSFVRVQGDNTRAKGYVGSKTTSKKTEPVTARLIGKKDGVVSAYTIKTAFRSESFAWFGIQGEEKFVSMGPTIIRGLSGALLFKIDGVNAFTTQADIDTAGATHSLSGDSNAFPSLDEFAANVGLEVPADKWAQVFPFNIKGNCLPITNTEHELAGYGTYLLTAETREALDSAMDWYHNYVCRMFGKAAILNVLGNRKNANLLMYAAHKGWVKGYVVPAYKVDVLNDTEPIQEKLAKAGTTFDAKFAALKTMAQNFPRVQNEPENKAPMYMFYVVSQNDVSVAEYMRPEWTARSGIEPFPSPFENLEAADAAYSKILEIKAKSPLRVGGGGGAAAAVKRAASHAAPAASAASAAAPTDTAAVVDVPAVAEDASAAAVAVAPVVVVEDGAAAAAASASASAPASTATKKPKLTIKA